MSKLEGYHSYSNDEDITSYRSILRCDVCDNCSILLYKMEKDGFDNLWICEKCYLEKIRRDKITEIEDKTNKS